MSTFQDIKQAINLREFLADKVDLAPKAGKLFCLCPWHSESTPSMVVNERSMHCFGGCGTKDIFDYAKDILGLSTKDSIAMLSEVAGIRTQSNLFHLADTEVLHDAMRTAIFTNEGKPYLDYLLQRGFTRQAIETIGFGVVPEGRVPGIDPNLHCHGRCRASSHRLAIPLYTWHGKVKGFKYRTIQEGVKPKYMHEKGRKADLSPFTPPPSLSPFSESLGLLCEGEIDAAMLCQHGLTGIAISGCHLEPGYLTLLSRKGYTSIGLMLDSDKLFDQKTFALANINHPGLFELFIPAPHKDPCEWLAAEGREALLTQITKHQTVYNNLRSSILKVRTSLFTA